MTLSNNHKISFAASLSGILLGVLLLVPNYFTHNGAAILLLQLLVVIVLGFASGFVLKGVMTQSYLVAIVALSYTYALSSLVAVTKSIHYVIFVVLVALASLGMFHLSNKFFKSSKLSSNLKLLTAGVGFVVVIVICSLLGLYILRNSY